MEEYFEPIETEVGTIFGRDAIFLDEVKFDYLSHKICFGGEFNGTLCSQNKYESQYIRYYLTFSDILALRMIELDFEDFKGKSSFDMVHNSRWIQEMKSRDSASKVKPFHKHYFLQTYDDIFEIVSSSYELVILEIRDKGNPIKC